MKKIFMICIIILILMNSSLFSLDLSKSISVGQFRNTTQKSDYKWLEVAISDMLSNDLASLKKMPIVTREQLKALLEEQQLQLSGIIDEKTAIRAGQISGAGYILFGDFIIPSSSTIRINVNVIDVETGRNVGASSITGSPDQIFTLEKLLVVKLLESISVQLSESEKVVLFQMPTTSIKAIEQNYKGIIALEGNDRTSAKMFFEAAIAVDPFYREAQQNLEKASMSFTGSSLFDSALTEIEQKRQQIKAVQELRDYLIKNLMIVKFDGKPEIINTNTDLATVDLAFDWHVEYNKVVVFKIYEFFKKISQTPTGDANYQISILLPGKIVPEVIKVKWYKESQEAWLRGDIWWAPQFVLKNNLFQIALVFHGYYINIASSDSLIGDDKLMRYEGEEGSTIRKNFTYGSHYYVNEKFIRDGKLDSKRRIVFKGIKATILKDLTGIELLKTFAQFYSLNKSMEIEF
jgi:curli biogenesis system outer membrane secretion channel CsgG